MRINDLNLTGITSAEAARAQEAQKLNRSQGVRTGTAAADKSGDHVELSSALETLSRALWASGTERTNRVQALAALYQSGNYHPDSAATARGMVSEALLAEGH